MGFYHVPNEISSLISSPFDEISDDLVMNVLMFVAYDDMDISGGIAEMLRCMGRVSKKMHVCCNKVTDQVVKVSPFASFTIKNSDKKEKWIDHIGWIKSRGLKITKIRAESLQDVGGLFHLTTTCMHMLSICDTTHLERIDISPSSSSSHHAIQNTTTDVFRAELPFHSYFPTVYNYSSAMRAGGRAHRDTICSMAKMYWYNTLPSIDISNHLSTCAKNLKSLSIPMPLCGWEFTSSQNFSALTALSDRLEDLCLELWFIKRPDCGSWGSQIDRAMESAMQKGIENLAKAIRRMRMLKKFTLIASGCDIWGSLMITSASLEVIDAAGAGNVNVTVGDCQNLKVLKLNKNICFE